MWRGAERNRHCTATLQRDRARIRIAFTDLPSVHTDNVDGRVLSAPAQLRVINFSRLLQVNVCTCPKAFELVCVSPLSFLSPRCPRVGGDDFRLDDVPLAEDSSR